MNADKPVNWKGLRRLLRAGANNPQGAKLTYQAHYLPQPCDAQSGGPEEESPRVYPSLASHHSLAAKLATSAQLPIRPEQTVNS